MKSYLIDTNIFLRLLLNDNYSQIQKIEALFAQAKQKQVLLYVPQIVIFEIHFGLEKFYQLDKEEIREKVKAKCKERFEIYKANGRIKEIYINNYAYRKIYHADRGKARMEVRKAVSRGEKIILVGKGGRREIFLPGLING